MKHKKFELKTRETTIASYNATYDGYLQFCDDMGNEPCEENSEDYSEWLDIAQSEGGFYVDWKCLGMKCPQTFWAAP